jgi:hypothetical protein
MAFICSDLKVEELWEVLSSISKKTKREQSSQAHLTKASCSSVTGLPEVQTKRVAKTILLFSTGINKGTSGL